MSRDREAAGQPPTPKVAGPLPPGRGSLPRTGCSDPHISAPAPSRSRLVTMRLIPERPLRSDRGSLPRDVAIGGPLRLLRFPEQLAARGVDLARAEVEHL